MPRISTSISLLEKDIVELITQLIREQPEVGLLFSSARSHEDVDTDAVISAFSHDAAALLRAFGERHDSDLHRFAEAVEPQISPFFHPADSSYFQNDGLSIQTHSIVNVSPHDSQGNDAWNGIAWTHSETMARELPGGIVFRVDSSLGVLFNTALYAALTEGAAIFEPQSVQSLDALINSLAQATYSYLGVKLTSPDTLLLVLICCVLMAIKDRDKLFGTIDSNCICTYFQANVICRKSHDGKVTVNEIVDSFPHGSRDAPLGVCPETHRSTMPRCRFRNDDQACTMCYPGRRPHREDLEPADKKVTRIMDMLVAKHVFEHKTTWSDEFYFRKDHTDVLVVPC